MGRGTGLEQSARLSRSGVEPRDVGGGDQDRERLLDELVATDVLEVTIEGTLRLTAAAGAELRGTVAELSSTGVAGARAVLERAFTDEPGLVARLLDEWVSPLRLAAASVVAARVQLGTGALIAASELTTRLSLARLLGAVVVSGGSGLAEEADAEVDAGQLLALLLFAGVLVEADDALELSDAFLEYRDHQRIIARDWKAARRRELLGELLLLQDAELSEAFRLAGFPDTVSELATLHRFTALTSLALWTGWQTLAAFDRPFQDVDGSTIEDWMTGEVIVMISSPSSPPAQQLEAVLAEAVRGQGLPVAVVNADTERELCERFGVARPPMILVLRDGEELGRTMWSPAPLALRTFIDETFDDGGSEHRRRLPIVHA